LSEIYIERGRKRNNREAEKELDELKGKRGGGEGEGGDARCPIS